MNTLTNTQLELIITVLNHYSYDLESDDDDLKNRIQLIVNKLTRTS